MSPSVLLAGLLVLILATALGTVQARNLYAATILLGIYSLLMALTWTVMHAMDVAFTEAAVGAGISTILLFAALVRIGGKETEKPSDLHWPALIVVVLVGAFLIYGTLDMPHLGDRSAPIHERAAHFYMGATSRELTHSKNMVTAVLASYRGYDTLFETAVIFTAGMGMILLLRPERREEDEDVSQSGQVWRESVGGPEPKATDQPISSGRLVRPGSEGDADLGEQPALRKVSKTLIPFIIVFGVYVITHGELGPGGGFQGGVIIAAAYLLTALVFGLGRSRQLLPRAWSDVLPGVGVLVYAGVGLATALLGGHFLEYDRLAPDPHHLAAGQTIGMTLVEMGVGITVSTVMVTVFSEMVEE